MRNLFYILLIINFTFISAKAQKCITNELRAAKLAQFPDLQERINDKEKAIQQWITLHNDDIHQKELLTFPIVVHILHNAPNENISDEQILSQIEVLNKDFRKLNANFPTTPTAFGNVATDMEIEFCLASIDPDGNPTSGITRTSVSNNFDIQVDYWDSQYGGQKPWDNKRYINIWIGRLSGGTLGFAVLPGEAQWGDDDGMVIDYRAWGTIGTATNNAPNNKGRTATHEMGHYLGLEHPWGPNSGGCNEDDFVSDTPPQKQPNYGCPIFPTTDDCTGGNGIMFVNFMDYTDDICMTMFTQGQKTRVLAAINTHRAGLLTSNACGLMTNSTAIHSNIIHIYPNPATDFLMLDLTDQPSTQIKIFNVQGQVLFNHIANGNSLERLDISYLQNGIYFVQIAQNEIISTKKIMVLK